MKKLLTKAFATFITLLLFASSASPAHAGVVTKTGTTNGLVGWWTLDGAYITDKVYDRSGRGNNGYFYNGATSTAIVTGKVGQAVQFNGSDNYIKENDSNSLDVTTNITLSAWIYKKTSSRQAILAKWGDSDSYYLDVFTGEVLRIWLDADGVEGGPTTLDSVSTIPLNKWTHVAMTYDGVTIRLFINGVQDNSTASSISIFQGTSPLWTGATASSDSSPVLFFNGSVDDVRVYNRALSYAEIQQLYNSTQSVSKTNSSQNNKIKSGLVGLWSFDAPDVAGTVTYDRSGNGNNGTLNGGVSRILGKLGQAMSFDGVDDYARITNSSSLNTTSALTYSYWIKGNSWSNDPLIMSNHIQSNGSPVSGVIAYVSSSNKPVLQMRVNNTCCQTLTANSSLSLNKWYFIANVWTGTQMFIYINGVSDVAPGSNSGTLSVNRDTFLGTNSDSFFSTPANWFNGYLDDARIYNRALSSDEIKRLYNEGASSKTNTSQNLKQTSGLVGLWSFDAPDIAGVTAYDRSGSGNNGTLTNGPTKILGKIGQALNLDGSDDHIVAGSTNIPTGSSARTVSFWAKPTSATTAYVMSYGGVGENLLFGVTNNAGTWVFQGNGPGDLSSGVAVSVNVWTYISITYDGTTVKIYINGSLANSGARSLNTSASSFYIGQYLTGIQRFPGLVDDMRIYNRALSPDEIKRLYNLGR